MVLAYLLLALFQLATALNVTAPTADEVIDISKPYNIKWISTSGDPAQVSIDVVNATAAEAYVLVNNVRGANVSDLNYTLHWAAAIPSDTAAYSLVFLDYATGGYLAQSAVFNLTLPAGETRNTTAGNAPASPGTTSAPASSSKGISTGALAAAIVVPVIFVFGLAIAAYVLWRRRRQRNTQKTTEGLDEATTKPEMDGKGLPASGKQHPAELTGDKSMMKWELPTTPPRTSVNLDPQELPAEVPVSEMPVGARSLEHIRKHDDSAISEDASTAVDTVSRNPDGSVTGVSPLVTNDGFEGSRGTAERESSLISPRISGMTQSVSGTTTGRNRFQEALYDLVSDELRRPE